MAYPLTVRDPAATAGRYNLPFLRGHARRHGPHERGVWQRPSRSLLVNTPGGAFNSPFNSSWNAPGINPAFLPVFPDLADDTYATVGLMGPASTSGIAEAADPSLWRMPPNRSRLTF